mgnify:CR=1 FL=1
MTATETTAVLRQYNLWRRGTLDGMPQPDPREIGIAIDSAVELIERLSAIEEAAKNLVKVKGRYHSEIAYKRLADALDKK